MKNLLVFSVVVLSLCSCTGPGQRKQGILKEASSFAAQFNFSALKLRVIASSINEKEHTMSVLFGNPIASAASKSSVNQYPSGSSLIYVTWKKQSFLQWLGFESAAEIQSVELLNASDKSEHKNLVVYQYKKLEGRDLTESLMADPVAITKRIQDITSQRASMMP